MATDVFPELVDWIRAGKVAATVEQRPLGQGTWPSGMGSNLDAVLERRFGTTAVQMPER